MTCWADWAFGVLVGVAIGLFVGALAQNRLDEMNIERGWFESRGRVFIITPAKVVAP